MSRTTVLGGLHTVEEAAQLAAQVAAQIDARFIALDLARGSAIEWTDVANRMSAATGRKWLETCVQWVGYWGHGWAGGSFVSERGFNAGGVNCGVYFAYLAAARLRSSRASSATWAQLELLAGHLCVLLAQLTRTRSFPRAALASGFGAT